MGGLDGETGASRRVIDHDVGVSAGHDLALTGVQTKHPCRRRAADLHPARERDATINDPLVDEVHPMLHRADPIGNLGEIADAEFLLLLEAERAVVGAHNGEVTGAEVAPELVLMALLARAQGSGADVLRTLEPGRGEMLLE